MTTPTPPLQDPGTFPLYQGTTYPVRRSDPGYAEIKKHSVAEIKKGLTQLYKVREARKGQPDPAKHYLVTYAYQEPPTTHGKIKIEVFLLEPRPGKVVLEPAGPGRGGNVTTWLNGLGRWWRVSDPVDGPEHTLAGWRKYAGGTVFGSMIERFVREKFLARLGKPQHHGTLRKGPTEPGPDVDWYEISHFLYELASELGDVSARR